MNLAPCLGKRGLYSLVQMALDQKIRTFCIDANAGKIGAVSNAAEPGMQFHQVQICAEKARNNNDPGSISMRYANAIVDGRGMKQENLGSEQCFGPK